MDRIFGDSNDSISHFFFDKDKNYILKEAQLKTQDKLILELYNKTVDNYKIHFNPLGIVDSTVKEILQFRLESTATLEGIYENLSAIYRYKFGNAQLEIIWDGRSHLDTYGAEWCETYLEWIADLANNKTFIKGILHLTVFKDEFKNTFFVNNILKGIINEYFDLKVLKVNGLKRLFIKLPSQLKAS